MAKFETPMKGRNSKSYGPLATILPLHLSYLKDQVWYKFHWSRTTNISYLKPKKGDITPRVMDPWPLFWYTQYIQSLSMFIQTISFLAFIVPEKSVTKVFENGKIWKPMKGHNSKSYGPSAILPLHLTYLRDQVWYKFCQSRRTPNIKVIEQNAF